MIAPQSRKMFLIEAVIFCKRFIFLTVSSFNIAKKLQGVFCGIFTYFLVWSNDSDNSTFLPYKYNNEYGHEMTDEFIDFYNWDKTIFANQNNFY